MKRGSVVLSAEEAVTVRRAILGYLEALSCDREETERMETVLAKVERSTGPKARRLPGGPS